VRRSDQKTYAEIMAVECDRTRLAITAPKKEGWLSRRLVLERRPCLRVSRSSERHSGATPAPRPPGMLEAWDWSMRVFGVASD